MPSRLIQTALNNLTTCLTAKELAASDDVELLARFVERRDEAAFTAIVQRHGDMVRSVCRRALGHEQDAEDAGQATFLVLARRAGSIRKAQSLASWLHGVALKISADLRRKAQRQAKSKDVSRADVSDPATPATWQEAMKVLDEELALLPHSYRTPLVLCYLEGQAMDAAAKLLGWTSGSFRGRLERGRELLRKRLTRRGITLPTVLFGVGLTSSSASAALSAAKIATTLEAAARLEGGSATAAELVSAKVVALSEGMVKSMAMSKFKCAAILTAIFALMGLGGSYLATGLAAHQAEAPKTSTAADAKSAPRAKSDQELLQGDWSFVAGEARGKTFPLEIIKDCVLTFKANRFSMHLAESKVGTYTLDPSASPRTIDLTADGGVGVGIYALEGDTLKLCISEKGKQNRPTEFGSKDAGSFNVYFVLKRVAAAKLNADDKKNDVDKTQRALATKNLILQQQVKVLERSLESANTVIGRLKDAMKKEREGISGSLAKIDVEKNVLSITLRNTKLVLDAVPFANSTKFFLNGKECSIDDLKVGLDVSLEVETVAGRTRITGVRGQKPPEKKNGPESTLQKFSEAKSN